MVAQIIFKLFDKAQSAFWGRVPSVRNHVNDGLDLVVFGNFEQGKQMVNVAVNPTVANEANEMEFTAVFSLQIIHHLR